MDEYHNPKMMHEHILYNPIPNGQLTLFALFGMIIIKWNSLTTDSPVFSISMAGGFKSWSQQHVFYWGLGLKPTISAKKYPAMMGIEPIVKQAAAVIQW